MEHDCNDTNLEDFLPLSAQDSVVQNFDNMPPVIQLSQKIPMKRVNEEWSLSENDSPKKSRRESCEVNSSRASSRTSCSTTASENENVITATTTTTNTDYENVTTATSTNIDLENISRCEPQDELSSVYHNTNTTAQPNKTSFKKFHYQGCFYNAIAKEMQAMKNDNYLDIIIFCKDNVSMRANSFLAGLAFVELRGIGELVGRDLIIPDISVDELNKLFENVLEFLGKMEVEESDVLPDTTAAEQADKMINTLQDVASNIDSVLLAVSARNNNDSKYIAYEDQTGGLIGYLPTNEAKMDGRSSSKEMNEKEPNQSDVDIDPASNTESSISAEDYFIAEEQVKVITSKNMESPNKHYPHKRPHCEKCNMLTNGLMDYFHHPCRNLKKNTCIICNNTLEEKKFRLHLIFSKDCKMKLIEKFYMERNDEITLLQFKSEYSNTKLDVPSKVKPPSLKVKALKSKVKRKGLTTYPCRECGKPFQGKCPYIHHKCFMLDPTRCKFCKGKFEDTNKKSKHFQSKSRCHKLIRKFDVTKLKIIFKSKENEGRTLSRVVKYCCRVCEKKFMGKAAYIHHKCLCGDPSRCKFCNVLFELGRKSKHFRNTKECRDKLKEESVRLLISENSLIPITNLISTFEQEKSTPSKARKFNCRHCRQDFPSKASFSHHKCLCEDPCKCKFCGITFDGNNKAKHFHDKKECMDKLDMEIEKVRRKSLSPEREIISSPCKIPKSSGLKCDVCGVSFSGYVSFYQHGCKFSGPKTKCRFCKTLFGDYKKFSNHISKPKQGQNCKAEFIEMIKGDFPDVIIEAHESIEEDTHVTEDKQFKDEVDKEKVVKKSQSPDRPMISATSCRIPKSSGLKCEVCEVSFKGYISFYQHQCMYSGPKNKCSFCEEIFDDFRKLSRHLGYPKGRKCKAEFIQMIKRDFPDVIIETHTSQSQVDTAAIAKVKQDHEKFVRIAKANRFFINLPKVDKNIPKEKIKRWIARIERKKAMKKKIKQNYAPVKKLEQEIKKEKVYQTQQHIQSQHVSTPLRAPSPLPGPHPIIEMDNADEDCVPRESQEFAEQDLGVANSVMNIKDEIALSNGHPIKSERVQNDPKDQLDKRSNYGHTIVPIKKEKKELIEVIEIEDDCDSEEDLQMQVKKELAEDKRAIDKGRAVVEEDTEDVGGAQGTNYEKLVTVRYENCLRIYCYGYLKKFLDKYKIEPRNIDKENYNKEKGIHTAIFKVSKLDAMKIIAEDIKPTKETIIKISE